MPKSKKKQRKTQDFGKVKLKLGEKQRASRATDVTVQVKRVALREQTALSAAEAAHDGSRAGPAETIAEAVQRLKNHAPSTRRDGLRRLTVVAERQPAAATAHVGEIVLATQRLWLDADYGVRQALLALWRLLAQTCGPAFVAAQPGLMVAHVCAGMTHIDERVRADALKALEVVAAADESRALEPFVPRVVCAVASQFGYRFSADGPPEGWVSRGQRVLVATDSARADALSILGELLGKMAPRDSAAAAAGQDPRDAVACSFAAPEYFAARRHVLFSRASATMGAAGGELPPFAPCLLLVLGLWGESAPLPPSAGLCARLVQCLSLFAGSRSFAESVEHGDAAAAQRIVSVVVERLGAHFPLDGVPREVNAEFAQALGALLRATSGFSASSSLCKSRLASLGRCAATLVESLGASASFLSEQVTVVLSA